MRHLLQVDEGKAGLDHGCRVWNRFGRPIGRNTVFLWMLVPVFVLLGLRIYVPVLQGIVLAFRQYNMLNLSNTGFNGLANFSAVILDVHVSSLQPGAGARAARPGSRRRPGR